LHALDIATGQEKPGSPTTIDATYPGTGDGSVNGQIAFNPLTHLQRAGLLLNQGNVYITWASYCDNNPYHGWIMAYDKDSVSQTTVWMTTPNGQRGGIWITGAGLAADNGGNIYAVVGNGTFDEQLNTPLDFGDSILKLALNGNKLTVVDYFTPYNQGWLADQDLDVGSSGALLVPIQRGLNPYELVTAGKEGKIYVVSRDRMGHFQADADGQIVQIIDDLPQGGMFSTAVSWNGSVFTGAVNDAVRAYAMNRGRLSVPPTSLSAKVFGWPGASLSISSNGLKSGILWALETAPWATSVLHAYDATNLQNELYNSSQNEVRDKPGIAIKFVVPTVANGRVYVATDGGVSVYGSLSSVTPTPTISPWGGTYDASQRVTIMDDRQDATIYYTLDGSTPTQNSPVYTGPFQVQTSTVVKAIAVAPSAAPSGVRIANFTTITGGGVSVNYGAGFQHTGLNLEGAATLVGSRLRLTDGGSNEASNAWYSTPVNVQAFTQDFLIQLTNPTADGMAFVIQNASATALAYGGGNLGYSPLAPSAGVKFDLYDNIGEGQNSTGLYTGGSLPMLPAVDLRGTKIDLHGEHILAVHMTYDGATLAMNITDTDSNQSFSTQWVVDIPGAVGGNTAYIGFGGGTGGLSAVQDVLSWSFVSQVQTPTPAISPWGGTYNTSQTVSISDDRKDATIYYTLDGSTPTQNSPVYTGAFQVQTSTVVKAIASAQSATLSKVRVANFTIVAGGGTSINYGVGFQQAGVNLEGAAALAGSRLRLSDGDKNEGSNAWYSNPVNVQSFTQDFIIQLTSPTADGMSFVIQNAGGAALGFGAGNLGYSPLAPSAGVKFDLYDNVGEGPNSTGLYTGGNLPMLPAVDLRGTNIDLHSEHILAVHMTYDGATLVMQITDSETNHSFSTEWTVDIPGAVGGAPAYVGFGAGTGGVSAVQDVLSWTFVSQSGMALRPRGKP
jgi:hypothetical protein